MARSRCICPVLILLGLLAPFSGSAQELQGLFERRPSWSSAPPFETTSGIALGDVDRDGDLDLVCAVLGQPSSLYLNEGKRLSRSRAWQTASADSSRAVAVGMVNRDRHLDVVFAGPDGIRLFLGNGATFEDRPAWTVTGVRVNAVEFGDVDGDGDLDLVCANEGACTLYRNVDGALDPNPAWLSPAALHSSLALGDVNGDGAIDLVLGRTLDRNALFLNTGGVFASSPAWEADSLEVTTGVALGDLDGDGRFDLICANSGTPSVWYRNLGQVFDAQPAWRAAIVHNLSSVAVGDVDLDGDLDVAFGHATGGFNPTGSYLFLTQNDSLATSPAWESSTDALTNSIALGDINGDGDLDLVCGNGAQSNYIYYGMQALFPFASWSVEGSPSDFALADVDADGDLDLIVGHLNQAAAFHRNDDGALGSDPVWTTNRMADANRSVALGDVDGDGDLDLLCGNQSVPNALWLFDRKTGDFGAVPVWESDRIEATRSVALADFDADGDLDLLYSSDRGSFILRNHGRGGFDLEPLWTADLLLDSPAVAAGDVDRDGWLDVVIASPSGTHLFHNDRGRFSSQPVWSLEFPESTRDIALGDMDGDGDLDLVCGNYLDRNTLYRNNGGAFESISAWLPQDSFGTVAIALGDVDADGDLDVFSASEVVSSGLYFNTTAGLENDPVWGAGSHSGSVFGDVDRDGDLDLIVGSHLGSAQLFPGHRAPTGGFDPFRGRARQPNEPAQLRDVHVTSTGRNNQNIAFRAYDAEADSVWILAEYQQAGSATWTRISQPGIVPPMPGLTIGPFAASPSGVANNIVWDLSTLLYGRFDLALRLRVVSPPQHAGFIQFIPTHWSDVGTVIVRRPFLDFAQLDPLGRLVLPTVTVGDTVVTSFSIENLGNDTLRVHSITPPFDGQLRLDNTRPFDVEPGGSRPIRAEYTPFESPRGPGVIRLSSNDPNRPAFSFDVIAPTLELRVRTQVLSIEDTVRLAQALTIQALPLPNVFIERATLFYRLRGSDFEFAGIPMRRLPGDPARDGPLLANLAGDLVTEAGLEYYVELENSGIVATDPAGAPDGGVFEVHVQRPQSFTVTPLANSTVGFLAGRPVDVIAEVPAGAQFAGGMLFWRRGGTSAWNREILERFDFNDGIATIPDSGVGERGIEYYVVLQTLTAQLESPPGGPMNPSHLAVRVSNLRETLTHPAGRYRMVSIPLDLEGRNLFIDDLLVDGEGFGSYDPTRWRLFRYDPDADANIEFTRARSDLFEPRSGAAFWLVSRSAHRVDTAPVEGISSTTFGGRQITLKPGWNQIGNPFAFPVAWSSVVSSVPLAPPVAFDPNLGASGGYVDEPVAVLQPFAGYFVENPSDQMQTLTVPAVEFRAPVGVPAAAAGGATHWWMRLAASSNAAVDDANRFGVDARARDARDGLDAPEPPAAPGDWVQLAFVQGAERLRHDWRAPAEGHVWDVEVRSATRGAEVRVATALVEPLPADFTLRLLDLEQGTSVAFGETDYTLIAFGAERPYRLRLLAGTAAWVARVASEQAAIPVHFIADRAAPNPFHGATRFRFGLPAASAVDLEVFDVRGARVATLARGERLPAGYHVRIWKGDDAAGRPVANGIYFAHLRAGDRHASWRLTVLR